MATPSTCLQRVSSKIKCDSLVASDKSPLNSDLLKPTTVSDFLKSSFVQISMVSSEAILVINQVVHH